MRGDGRTFMRVIYQKISIIGMGLIGSSIALATRRGEAAKKIIGSDIDAAAGTAVEKLGLVDDFFLTLRVQLLKRTWL